jgi:DNA polymerase elongation subunit (family B)
MMILNKCYSESEIEMNYVFIYSWQLDDEVSDDGEMQLTVRAYGINASGENVCLHIHGFYPYFFIEFNMSQDWTNYRSYLMTKIQDRYKGPAKRPFSISRKQKLYFYQEQAKHPFMRMRFPSIGSRKTAYYRLNKFKTKVMGKDVQMLVHEFEASPLLQLVCDRNIPTAGWIRFDGRETTNKVTQCHREYQVKVDDLHPVDEPKEEQLGIINPVSLSFDIEVYSANPKRMPSSDNDSDCIFQISSVIQERNGDVKNHLIVLGATDKSLSSNTTVINVKSEKQLLLEWRKLVIETNPNILIGYNIFGFDLPYMIARAKRLNIFQAFDVMGMHLKNHAKEKEIRWSSSAYANQEFHLLDTEGRLFIDLLPIIRRDYKFANYKLKTVSTFFLGETKDPLTHLDIFKAFEEGQKNTSHGKKLLSRCGKYCVQDASLVLKLFYNLQLWIGLVEMAKICNVPIMFLFTQGQQIKVYSQVYKKGCIEGILIQSSDTLSEYSEVLASDAGYSGAYVFPPSPGVYEWVVPFDFSSLYPTTIIAYNIDYSTLVLDPKVPDDQCHVIEWEDHIGCPHDTIVHATKPTKILCAHHRFRFKKEPQGVIPSLLKHLLDMRSRTKKQMKQITSRSDIDKDQLEVLHTSLDKRQLAYKVSANSMYGAMGVKKGYIPFMPGAMSTTAMGRLSIQKAAAFVQKKHKGQLIYGDTDSIYCHFSTGKNAAVVWDQAKKIEKEFLALFPPPMKLVFEEKIYKVFLILTKKRYMAYTCNEDGSIDDKLTIRGVLLARRDNCRWIREVYEVIVRLIMEGATWAEVEDQTVASCLSLFRRTIALNRFVITKAVGKDYKVRPLPTDTIKLDKRLKDLGIMKKTDTKDISKINEMVASQKETGLEWVNEYIQKSKPAHVQLADKMGRRGHPVEVGSRIEYVIVENCNPKAKQYEKIEDPIYCKKHGDLVHIDALYYLQSLAKPLDQLFMTVFKKKDFVAGLCKIHVQYQKVLDKIIHRPVLQFEGLVEEKPTRKKTVAKTIYDYL